MDASDKNDLAVGEMHAPAYLAAVQDRSEKVTSGEQDG